jgi:hypothetical protein
MCRDGHIRTACSAAVRDTTRNPDGALGEATEIRADVHELVASFRKSRVDVYRKIVGRVRTGQEVGAPTDSTITFRDTPVAPSVRRRISRPLYRHDHRACTAMTTALSTSCGFGGQNAALLYAVD